MHYSKIIISIVVCSLIFLNLSYSEEAAVAGLNNQNGLSFNALSVVACMFEISYERYLGSSMSMQVNTHYSPNMFWQSGAVLAGAGLGLRWYFLDTGMKNFFVNIAGSYVGIFGEKDLKDYSAPGYKISYQGDLIPLRFLIGYKWISDDEKGLTVEPAIGLGYELGRGFLVKYTDSDGNVLTSPPSSSTLQLASTYEFFWTGLLFNVRVGWAF